MSRLAPVVVIREQIAQFTVFSGFVQKISLADIQSIALNDGRLSFEMKGSEQRKADLNRLPTERRQEVYELLLKRIADIRQI